MLVEKLNEPMRDESALLIKSMTAAPERRIARDPTMGLAGAPAGRLDLAHSWAHGRPDHRRDVR